MQTAIALRRFSINSIAAVFVVLLTLTAGGAGGYWLKGQALPPATVAAVPPVANNGSFAATQAVKSNDVVAKGLARHAAEERADAGQ